MSECGKRYGYDRKCVCRLPVGHRGRHSIRRNLAQIMGRK